MGISRYQVKSKSTVAYVLQCLPETRPYLPATEILSKYSFYDMVLKFDQLFLKPDRGRKSRGIIRIERLRNDFFVMQRHNDDQPFEYHDLSKLWEHVRDLTFQTRYIIQQGIKSVTIDHRYFDLRCHALRIDGKWKVGGICARVGAPGKIITTSHQGGQPVQLETLFHRYLRFSRWEQELVKNQLHDCTIKAVQAVSPVYPRNREFAVDVGLDAEKRVWIYEVNNQPLIRGNFRLLPDKSLYNRIRYLRKRAK